MRFGGANKNRAAKAGTREIQREFSHSSGKWEEVFRIRMNQARKRASPHGAAGDRDRYTYYDSDVSGQTRGLVVAIEQTVRPTQLFTVHGKLSRA